MNREKIESYLGADFRATRDIVFERITRYVEIETPSGNTTQINLLAGMIEADLTAIGASVELMHAGALGTNLVARFDGAESNLPPILMLAHIDTVHEVGTLAARPLTVRGDRAEGPGVYDMKAGVALLIETVAWHMRRRGNLPRPVVMLITCDEEIGSHSSRGLIDHYAREASVVLVPEPCLPDGGVKTARKGVATYEIAATGLASHAGGDPARHVSAITEIILQADKILTFADHSKGTTINIGTIRGGTATNVVAAEATIGVDVRLAVQGEDQRIDQAMRSLTPTHPQATVRIVMAESRPPLVRNAAVVEAYEKARACALQFDVDLHEGLSGGGSDGSLAAATGVAVLDGLGPRGDGAHAVDEHIIIDDLPFRLALLCRLVECL
jgi:glutamate carboxypeptidase